MKLVKAFLIRLLIVAVPLFGLFIYSSLALEENLHKEHKTDVGLGIAIILGMVLTMLFIGFTADLIYRVVNKQYKMALIDLPFLIPFGVAVVYINSL